MPRCFQSTRDILTQILLTGILGAGGTALLLAGLRLGDRFVLVTCEPDAVVGRVHSRMPLSLTAPEALAWLDRSTDARDLLARHAPVPLEAQEEPAPTRRPSDSDQMSLF